MRFTWFPDLGSEKSIKPSISVVKFNDDYEARIKNSLNPILRIWNCTFTSNLNTINAIESFLESAEGQQTFDWVDPQGRDGKYVCREWSSKQIKFGVHQLSASLEEVIG